MIQRLQLSICVLCSVHYSRQEPSLLFLFVLDLALYLPLPGAVYIHTVYSNCVNVCIPLSLSLSSTYVFPSPSLSLVNSNYRALASHIHHITPSDAHRLLQVAGHAPSVGGAGRHSVQLRSNPTVIFNAIMGSHTSYEVMLIMGSHTWEATPPIRCTLICFRSST